MNSSKNNIKPYILTSKDNYLAGIWSCGFLSAIMLFSFCFLIYELGMGFDGRLFILTCSIFAVVWPLIELVKAIKRHPNEPEKIEFRIDANGLYFLQYGEIKETKPKYFSIENISNPPIECHISWDEIEMMSLRYIYPYCDCVWTIKVKDSVEKTRKNGKLIKKKKKGKMVFWEIMNYYGVINPYRILKTLRYYAPSKDMIEAKYFFIKSIVFLGINPFRKDK